MQPAIPEIDLRGMSLQGTIAVLKNKESALSDPDSSGQSKKSVVGLVVDGVPQRDGDEARVHVDVSTADGVVRITIPKETLILEGPEGEIIIVPAGMELPEKVKVYKRLQSVPMHLALTMISEATGREFEAKRDGLRHQLAARAAEDTIAGLKANLAAANQRSISLAAELDALKKAATPGKKETKKGKGAPPATEKAPTPPAQPKPKVDKKAEADARRAEKERAKAEQAREKALGKTLSNYASMSDEERLPPGSPGKMTVAAYLALTPKERNKLKLSAAAKAEIVDELTKLGFDLGGGKKK